MMNDGNCQNPRKCSHLMNNSDGGNDNSGYVYRCNQLQQVLPGPISKWLKVLSQPWEGDVTMVLPSTYSQIKKAVTNPSKRDLQIACLQVLLITTTYCIQT